MELDFHKPIAAHSYFVIWKYLYYFHVDQMIHILIDVLKNAVVTHLSATLSIVMG